MLGRTACVDSALPMGFWKGPTLQQEAVPRAIGRQTLVRKVDELAALYQLTDALYRAHSLAEVYEAALDAILKALGCERASILLFDETGVMRFVAWRGLSDHYRTILEGHSPWKPGDRDPKPIFVDDIRHTSEPEWIRDTIVGEGICGLAFIPLAAQGNVVGKFMTYYPEPHAFAKHEAELAVTIARHVGFSVERFRAEAARKAAEEEIRHSEVRFRLMSENAPVMIWTSDSAGRCLHMNKLLRTFWDVNEAEIAEFDWQATMHPDDAEEVSAAVGEALQRQVGFTVKGRYRDANGEYRVLQTHGQPYFSAKDKFAGMIGVNIDITEREEAERALRQSEERFRLAVEAAPNGMVMTDNNGRIVLINNEAEKLFGYDDNELVGQSVEVLVPERFRTSHPDYRLRYQVGPSARPMGAGRELFALRKDGSEIPVEIGLSPIETPDGAMTLAAVVDIGERKRADVQRELLLAELNHRVKNTLAVVQAIAHQTFRTNASPEAREAFDGRLMALAAAHNLLTQSDWQQASLEQIATDALQAQGLGEARIALKGPSVLLPPKEALAIALALHELHTNAVKYGALSNDSGRVAVSWELTNDGSRRLSILWRESGGPPVLVPTRKGFGSKLFEQMLAQDLNGEVVIDFRPEGVVCTIDAPLEKEWSAA